MSLRKHLAYLRAKLTRQRARAATLHTAITETRGHIGETKQAIILSRPLRLRAFDEAVRCVGIVEKGGNNRGPEVEAIIKENAGAVGEPWCGDFMAHCYRKAGSVAVDRSWASVELTGHDPLVKATLTPRQGDLVRFTFDHIGMFVRDTGAGSIETIEGNTSTGAVSDSNTGADGVERKIRSKTLVRDYLTVLR